MDECVFCRIAGGVIPVAAVEEDERVFCFADGNPQAPVHLLVIPKVHYGTVEEVPEEMLGVLLATAARVGKRVLPGGHRIVVNTRGDGGQTVGHVHLHVLGGRRMGWPPG